MGHNRAGDGAKLKERRRKREEARLAQKAEKAQQASGEHGAAPKKANGTAGTPVTGKGHADESKPG
jgi:hypothetical protein